MTVSLTVVEPSWTTLSFMTWVHQPSGGPHDPRTVTVDTAVPWDWIVRPPPCTLQACGIVIVAFLRRSFAPTEAAFLSAESFTVVGLAEACVASCDPVDSLAVGVGADGELTLLPLGVPADGDVASPEHPVSTAMITKQPTATRMRT